MVHDVQFVSNAGIEIVTLAQAKKQLRLEATYADENDLIDTYIETAVVNCENYIGGHVFQKNMTVKMDAFDGLSGFSCNPLQSIVSVKFYPADGSVLQTLSPLNYDLTRNQKTFQIHFKQNLPKLADRFDAVIMELIIGYPVGKTPKPIVSAILLQIADLYERREDRTEVICTQSISLLRPYKNF